MNIWGSGPFGNDSAAVFVQEVVADGVPALQEAFEVVLDPDLEFVEAEEGQRALAAAGVLAAALGGDTSDVVDAGLRAWLAGTDPAALAPLRPLAAEALARVLGPRSELPELWEDGENAEAWYADTERLRAALGG
ncbi:DUF4259 domain-containing protein [Deinococcus petrolearius]|uniref:DUF4259 domain-containing protein n=1 Tax=Deinococcus petrolearius TaxID=1751295 RepID=A0ABW1DGY5_9DEIO